MCSGKLQSCLFCILFITGLTDLLVFVTSNVGTVLVYMLMCC